MAMQWEYGAGEYTTQDLRGRVWRLWQTSAADSHWALSCDGHPKLSAEIKKVGGWREFDFAEAYILRQG